jgi:hypothetical protein
MLSPHERSQAEGPEPDGEHGGGHGDHPEGGVLLSRPARGVRNAGEGGREEEEERAERGPLLGRRHEP